MWTELVVEHDDSLFVTRAMAVPGGMIVRSACGTSSCMVFVPIGSEMQYDVLENWIKELKAGES